MTSCIWYLYCALEPLFQIYLVFFKSLERKAVRNFENNANSCVEEALCSCFPTHWLMRLLYCTTAAILINTIVHSLYIIRMNGTILQCCDTRTSLLCTYYHTYAVRCRQGEYEGRRGRPLSPSTTTTVEHHLLYASYHPCCTYIGGITFTSWRREQRPGGLIDSPRYDVTLGRT